MIFRRYADPMSLLNGMLSARQLTEFVGESVKMYNEEYKEKALWEVWLHRAFDQSYSDFLASVGEAKRPEPTQEEVSDIVTESESILQKFIPG